MHLKSSSQVLTVPRYVLVWPDDATVMMNGLLAQSSGNSENIVVCLTEGRECVRPAGKLKM